MVASADASAITTAHPPVVVVDDLHVDYHVYATGKKAGAENHKLFKKRRTLETIHALKGVSFTVCENESVGIIGHNGSGKSTLMRAIVGLTPASKGAVYSASRPNLLGVGAALINELSGSDNVILDELAIGYTREENADKHDDIVEFSGLNELNNYPMNTYSSGMSARLKSSIATARTHDILIVDEALAVGDKAFQKKSEARIN